MSVGRAMLLAGAYCESVRLRSRRGSSCDPGVCGTRAVIWGFVALGVDSLLDRVRDSNFLVGLTWGEGLELEPGGVWVSDRTGW